MHPYNEAWLALSKYSRDSMTVSDVTRLEKDVAKLMETWRERDGFDVQHLGRPVKGVKIKYETLPGNRLIVDVNTIHYTLLL